MPRLRFYLNRTAVLLYNALYYFKPHASTFTHFFGSKKWVEHLALDLWRYARAIVNYKHLHKLTVAAGFNGEGAFTGGFHGINGIVNKVGPNLVKLANKRLNFGQGFIKIFNDVDV